MQKLDFGTYGIRLSSAEVEGLTLRFLYDYKRMLQKNTTKKGELIVALTTVIDSFSIKTKERWLMKFI